MSLLRRLSLLLLTASLAPLGCHAQTPAAAPGTQLSPALARRVEVLLRQKAQLPPGSVVSISPATPSELPGFSSITVTFTADGKTSRPAAFLISSDGKTLAQFSKYDISADPRNLVSAEGRPSRGGPANAPGLIVGFDDLECPFCAELNHSIFPALTERYGDKIHIVYKDLPIEQHPWALHAAVDVNCLAAQSPTGYWNLVDYIHAHASEMGQDPKDAKADKTLMRAEEQLDQLTREQDAFQKVDLAPLNACITKQDATAVNASSLVAASLGVDSTPTLFINGAKVDGAVPLQFICQMVDDALRAQGVTPPPPYVAPASGTPKPPTAAAKPGQ